MWFVNPVHFYPQFCNFFDWSYSVLTRLPCGWVSRVVNKVLRARVSFKAGVPLPSTSSLTSQETTIATISSLLGNNVSYHTHKKYPLLHATLWPGSLQLTF